MMSAHAELSVFEELRKELKAALERETNTLIDRTSDRQAGRVQMLRDISMMLDRIVERRNDQRSQRNNPQQ